MEEKNIFDILENTEQSVIDRLSEEFPPDDAEEKEKVFRMSQEKFNKANNTSKFTETDEQTVSGVEVVRKRPLWKKCLSMAAAAAILIGGAAGGFKAYKHFANTPTISDKENITEEPTTEQTTTEQPTTEPLNNSCPFDFAAHEFSRPDPDSKTAIFVNFGKSEEEGGDGRTGFSLQGGNVIPLEKRQELADFFNSLEWEETDVHNRRPEFLNTYERFCFYSLSDDDFIILNFDDDQSTMTLTSCKIRLESDNTDENYDPSDTFAMNRMIQYVAVDDTIDINEITKCYKIDYDFIKNNIKEILGDDFRKPELDKWGFFGKEWSIGTDESSEPKSLTDGGTQAVYDILVNYSWELESQDNKKISEEEERELFRNTPPPESSNYAVLNGSMYGYNYIISLEVQADKTVAKYHTCLSNINENSYTEEIFTYTCKDTDIVNRIKEYLAYANREVPLDLSVIDRINWLCSSIDTKQFDITNDKMQKLKECLGRYEWKMTDNFSYFGFDIGITGTTDGNEDSITELRIGKDWDEKTMICFANVQYEYNEGRLAADKQTKSIFDCLNRLYVCDDENAYSEIEKILSE
ncbi:hypothetical protein [Ruminococcus flavefaciens]|uniref:hypothetical protein n=1 Tax=Ruminococcus flavefaciens TaxID=1265 RepID=UPI00048DAE0B|nr:hypothetical protein [Ruminococcus flavefaciens]